MKSANKPLSLVMLTAVLFCLLPNFGIAQNWLWAKSGFNTGYSEGLNCATDPLGNVYITGFFTPSSITFGSFTLSSSGGNAIYLVKYDASGNVLWAKSAGGVIADGGTSVATDRWGNVYLTGYFRSPTITFGAYTLTNAGGADIFIAKYDSSGNALWAKSAGGSLDDGTGDFQGSTISTDASGNAFITGYFNSVTISFGVNTLTNSGGRDVYIAKYDSSGNAVWAKTATGTADDQGMSVSADMAGNVYLVGAYASPTITFGTYTLSNSSLSYSDMFLVKYDTGGSVVWAITEAVASQTVNVPFNLSVVTDNFNHVFVGGGYQPATLTLGAFTLNNNSVFGSNVFIVKYDSGANVLWAYTAGGSSYDCAYCLSTDNSGNVYMTGGYSVSGNHSIIFGNDTLVYPGGATDPMFMVKYDSSGNVLCASSLASGGDDHNGVATDLFGNAYITGDFELNNFAVGATHLGLSGEEDIFTAKYVCSVLSAGVSPSAATCNGQCNGTATANPSSGTPPYTYLWSNSLTDATISNLCAGSYSITITDSLGHSATSSFTINQPAALTAATTSTTDTCGTAGGTATVTAGGGTPSYTFVWSNGQTTQTATALAAATYTVTVTDANGCSQTASATVQGINSSGVTINSDKTEICPTDSAQICAPAGLSLYVWSNGQSTRCIDANTSGDYYVTVTDMSGCTATSNHITISVFPSPPVSISVNGDTLSAYNAITYQWYLNGQPLMGDTTDMIIAAQSGVYTVAITDSNGCSATSSGRTFNLNGIQNFANADGLKIYPNPLISGNWQVEVSRDWIGAHCELYDATGKLVYQSEVKNAQYEINFNNMESGVYLFRLHSNTKNVSLKLIKL